MKIGMKNAPEYIESLNKEFGVSISGLSPHFGAKKMPSKVTRVIVKDFGNGLGRVLYLDLQGRLIANNMEPLLVGLAEAAEILGWQKQQVTNYISREKFPEPIMRLASGPLWNFEQIETFRIERERAALGAKE